MDLKMEMHNCMFLLFITFYHGLLAFIEVVLITFLSRFNTSFIEINEGIPIEANKLYEL